MSFSGGCFIHVTLFDFTVGEAAENVSDNNKILPAVKENTDTVVQARISEGMGLC